MKTVSILLLLVACTAYAVPQSGRSVNTPRPAPIAPVQPPANPEPEAPPPPPRASALTFLPEKILERRIKTLDNNSFRLADFHGKVMVINIWASWCGPCRREVPDYERIRREYENSDKIEFIGLTTDDPVDAAKVSRFVRDTGFNFRLGWAEEDMALVLMNGRRSIPQTIVIDDNGAVISHWTGYARGYNSSRLKEAIENALK